MKKITFIIICLLMLGIAAQAETDTSYAEDPSKIAVGARAMGMGKAMVAVADDSYSIFNNPAGLASLETWYINSMYTNLLNEVQYTMVSGIIPVDWKLFQGTMGLSVINSGVYDIIQPHPHGYNFFDYYDNLLAWTWGREVSSKLKAGLNLKYFSRGFTGTAEASGTGTNLDVGFLYTYSPKLTLGLNLQNVLPGKIGGITWNSSADYIPTLVKLGASYKLNEKFMLAFDTDWYATRNTQMPFHLGGEYYFNDIFTARAGIDQSLSADTGKSADITAGLSMKLNILRLDYAYHSYHDESENTTHYVSLSFSPAYRTAKKAPEKIRVTKEGIKIKEGEKFILLAGPYVDRLKRRNHKAFIEDEDLKVKEVTIKKKVYLKVYGIPTYLEARKAQRKLRGFDIETRITKE